MTTILRALATAAAIISLGASPAASQPVWASAETASIHPGVQTITGGGQCTSNFVFFSGTRIYLGQAAHCSSTSAATETDGCEAESLPLGTPVEIEGASAPGVMVYNSWLTMQALRETDADTCAFNDLALVEIAPADAGKVNPSIPIWGGPTAVGAVPPFGEEVYSYGNSGLRVGLEPLSPKYGIGLGPEGDGWSVTVFTLTPGIPGDSGSAFLDASGRAMGVVSTVAVAPVPASNGVGSIQRELQYLVAKGGLGTVALAIGTEPFDGDPVRLVAQP
jgi:hypothetical protein